MMQNIFFSAAILLVCMLLATNAQLRGKTVEELRNTPIKAFDKVKGKTLKELGVEKPRQLEHYKPSQLGPVVKFYAVYDEFAWKGGAVLGATAGINGFLFDNENFDQEQIIDKQGIIGYLNGACTIVGDPEDHFCTYEIVLFTNGDDLGIVVCTGGLRYAEEDGGFLSVEATGNEFSDGTGGVLSATYVSIGDVNVFAGELKLTM